MRISTGQNPTQINIKFSNQHKVLNNISKLNTVKRKKKDNTPLKSKTCDKSPKISSNKKMLDIF